MSCVKEGKGQFRCYVLCEGRKGSGQVAMSCVKEGKGQVRCYVLCEGRKGSVQVLCLV